MPDVNLDWLASGNLTKNQTDYDRYGLVGVLCFGGCVMFWWVCYVLVGVWFVQGRQDGYDHAPYPQTPSRSGLLKSYLKITTPAQLPPIHNLPITIVDEAIFLHFIFYFNYYHVFAEYAPTLHNVVCKYWGKCTYNPKEKLRIFMTSNWDTHWDHLWLKSLVSPDFIRFVSLQPVVNVCVWGVSGCVLMDNNVMVVMICTQIHRCSVQLCYILVTSLSLSSS